jgi:hypothetical protein
MKRTQARMDLGDVIEFALKFGSSHCSKDMRIILAKAVTDGKLIEAGGGALVTVIDAHSMLQQTNSKAVVFKCSQCNYVGDRLYHSMKHYERIHENGGRPTAIRRKYSHQKLADQLECSKFNIGSYGVVGLETPQEKKPNVRKRKADSSTKRAMQRMSKKNSIQNAAFCNEHPLTPSTGHNIDQQEVTTIQLQENQRWGDETCTYGFESETGKSAEQLLFVGDLYEGARRWKDLRKQLFTANPEVECNESYEFRNGGYHW